MKKINQVGSKIRLNQFRNHGKCASVFVISANVPPIIPKCPGGPPLF
jgi:hypothetical protein